MRVQVKKWGNSASVRLPSAVMRAAGLVLDQTVEVRVENGRLVVEPIPPAAEGVERSGEVKSQGYGLGDLTPAQSEEIWQELVESVSTGEYASTDGAIANALQLWQTKRREDAGRLQVLTARIRQSLDDPRPDLTAEAVDQRLSALFAITSGTADHA